MEWYCIKCWRHHSFMVDLPYAEGIRIGQQQHRWMVDQDMKALKVPAGMENYANTPIMDRYPSVDCSGDIRVGDVPAKRFRLNKKLMPSFDFEKESNGNSNLP